MVNGLYVLAMREAIIILRLRPDDPMILFIRGDIALHQGDSEALESVLKRIEEPANGELSDGMATNEYYSFKELIDQSLQIPQ